MRKFLAILMLSFLFGLAFQSCTNETQEELQLSVHQSDTNSDITPPEIKVPPGG